MTNSFKFDLKKLNHYIEDQCGGKEYYFGCWSPDPIAVEINNRPDNLQIEKGDNWFALRNGVDITDGLLFASCDPADPVPALIAFRGYLSEAGIHSYSDKEKVQQYWNLPFVRRHNGIFGATIISNDGKSLSFVSDIFGVGPIYYRKVGETVFFSSTPALLSLENDEKDMTSWILRMMTGYIPGDETLSKEIRQVPPASVMTFDKSGSKVETWYDYNALAKGELPVNDAALQACEDTFKLAMSRCRKIEYGDVKLPFSSGFDSRRIFAHLSDGKSNLETFTVQMPTGGGEDVDGTYAPMMSQDYGFPNKRFKIPTPEEWHKYNIQRIFSMDAQTDYHTWSVRVFNYFRGKKISIYDGLGGDVFGFYGWNFVYHPDKLMASKLPDFLNPEAFPPYGQVYSKFKKLHNEQEDGINKDLVSYCIWQSRSGTALWAQQQALPGQLIFCPYYDLDYIETMLNYSTPKGELYVLQARVLEKYWPKLAAYHGSGKLPLNAKKIGKYNNSNKYNSLKELLKTEFKSKKSMELYKELFTRRGRTLLWLAKFHLKFTAQVDWWAKHLVEMIYWWKSRPIIINIKEKNAASDEVRD